jgi:mannose-P-dolichol utilization defect protein 1
VPQESSSYLIQSIVKLLGYGVVVGASIVKLPQIIKIIKRKSAVGVSFSSTIL